MQQDVDNTDPKTCFGSGSNKFGIRLVQKTQDPQRSFFYRAKSSPVRLFFGRLLEGGECVRGGGPWLAAKGKSPRGHRGPHQARPALQHPLVLLALKGKRTS